jgi:histone H3/H4
VSADLTFRRCSICRREIEFEAKYWVCSVSTCNRSRTALYFCSVACWDAHLGETRHREAWAEERRAPTREAWAREMAAGLDDTVDVAVSPAPAPRRVVVAPPAASAAPPTGTRDAELPRDVLVVVSKLKAYVRARSGMNTSDSVIDVLSEHLRRVCDEAIRNAAADGRKTLMDRDFRSS